jgi:ABC-type multidrug transport system fused ATPase/permease subunit
MAYMRQNALFLAVADSAAGDYYSAFQHYKLYKAYSDSLRNDHQTKTIAQLESRHRFEKELEEKRQREEEAAAAEARRQERVYMLQSLGIFLFLIVMIVSLFFLGRLNWPNWTMKGLLYVALMMTFEFAMMLFEPLNDKYSQGLPIYKMLFNTLIAMGLGPLHHMAERKMAARLVKPGSENNDFKQTG